MSVDFLIFHYSIYTEKFPRRFPFNFFSPPNAKNWPGHREIPQKAIRNNAGMVPREDLEESVVRTGRDFPAGGNPCLSQGLTSVQALQFS